MRKAMQCGFDEVADLTFREAAILIQDESIPRIDRVRVCLPIAMKRIPDKHEVIQLTLNATDTDMRDLLNLANANLAARSLDISKYVVKPVAAEVVKPVTQVVEPQQVTATDGAQS